MNWLLQLPVIRSLHARGLLFVAVLLPLVAGVLLAGAMESEPTPDRQDSTAPTERSGPTLLSLRPDLEKTPLSYQSDYWEQLGQGVLDHLVLMGPRRIPGIVVEPGLVLTSALAVEPMATPPPPRDDPPEPGDAPANDEPPSPQEEQPEAGDIPVDDAAAAGEREEVPSGPGLVAVDWDEGLALFRLGDPATAPTFAPADASEFHPGAFAAAVTRTSSGRMLISPGYVTDVEAGSDATSAQPASIDVALVLSDDTPVAAVVDLDGDLLGAAIRRGDEVRLLAGQELAATMTRLKEGRQCYPIESADISDEIHALLGVPNGVAIERVRAKAFVAEPTLRPGDVLIEWDGEIVSSVDQLLELYHRHQVGESVRHVVLRGTRRVTGSSILPDRHCRPLPVVDELALERLGFAITMTEASATAGPAEAATWQVTRLEPGGPAEASGLTPGDLIVAANGRGLPERTARRTLERLAQGTRAIVFTVQRDGRVKLLAVAPPAE